MNGDHELNMSMMMVLFEQLYDQFSEFCSHTQAQRYFRFLDRYPRITDIASYGDIASYLNISRRQLQRIREIELGSLPKAETTIKTVNVKTTDPPQGYKHSMVAEPQLYYPLTESMPCLLARHSGI